MGADVYAVCVPCGVLVADLEAHALWHARIADILPLLVAAVTTLDPATGAPVLAVRPAAELADVDAAVTLRAQAVTALTTNATFLALATPTTAKAIAQVQALTQQTNALIRLVVRALS